MLARRCGKRPIVMPRRHHLGEAVDDHQMPLARRLADAGLVTLVEDEAALHAALSAPDGDGDVVAAVKRVAGADALSADVRAALAGLGAAPLKARAPKPVVAA
jgi:UDP-N-acetylglucosamine transferase subunit ALG13